MFGKSNHRSYFKSQNSYLLGKPDPKRLSVILKKKKKVGVHFIEKEAEKHLIDEIIENKGIVLNKINTTDPYIRKTVLNWIAKSMGNKWALLNPNRA